MDQNSTWYVKYTYGLAAVILTIYAMIMAKSVLLPLLFAVFFSILLSPVCGKLESKRLPRILSVFASILLGLIVIFGIGFFFYNQMTAFGQDADMFIQRLEEIFESADGILASWFAIEGEINLERVVSEIAEYVQDNTASLTRGLSGAASVLTAVFLVPVYMFLILLFRDLLKNFLMKVFARGDEFKEQKVQNIIEKVKTLVQRYISGVLIVIGILAVLNSLMLIIIGVEHAVFFGVFAAMLNIIPFVGPIMGSILPILYAFITMDSLLYPLIILIGFYIIQLFESNFFTPVIVGSQVSMNALATLLLLFIGAQIWGLAGMILFIPLGAILKIICDEVDSLNPYGYLLGRATGDKSEERSGLAKRVSKLSEKAKQKVGMSDEEATNDSAEENSRGSS